jgi:hypothetical protein
VELVLRGCWLQGRVVRREGVGVGVGVGVLIEALATLQKLDRRRLLSAWTRAYLLGGVCVCGVEESKGSFEPPLRYG